MKHIVLLTFVGSLALALTAWGAPRDRQARSAKAKTSSAHVGFGQVRHARCDGANNAERGATGQDSFDHSC